MLGGERFWKPRGLVGDHLARVGRPDVPLPDRWQISGARLGKVVEKTEACGTLRVGALLRGDGEGEHSDPERVLDDGFGVLNTSEEPPRPRQIRTGALAGAAVAEAEQVGARPGRHPARSIPSSDYFRMLRALIIHALYIMKELAAELDPRLTADRYWSRAAGCLHGDG
jgi:hypothetical protein